ncbi:MAG: ABC transporter permease [Candidatus Rokubacteria bacterium]|nr:ABC transporter permease [Candidatus Rokubacteria bacterium]
MKVDAAVERRLATVRTTPAGRLRGLRKFLPILGILVIWHILSRGVPDYILPSPFLVAQTFYRSVVSGEILIHLVMSMLRVFVGFGLAAIVGLAVGFFMAFSHFFRSQVDYLIRMVQPIPGIAWLGVVIIWFGLGETAIITVIIITVLPVIVLTTYEGFRSVDPELMKAARTLGARRQWHLFRYVTFPGALPHVMNGLHMGFGYGWRVLAAAEMIGATQGLGYWLNYNAIALRTEDVFVVLVFFAAAMIAFEEGVYRRVERRVLGGWLE